MKKFWKLFQVRNKEFFRDRGALGWNLAFPLLVIFGFAFMFGGGNENIFKVAAFPGPTQEAFYKTQYIQFIPAPELQPELEKLKRHQLDMVISEKDHQYWINSTSPKGYLVERILWNSAGASGAGQTSYAKQAVEGSEIRYVDWLISGLLAMNMMFSALFGVGYVIVRYRKVGVLRRLKAAPLNAFTFLMAQIVSRYILIVAATAVVYVGANHFIHFKMLGSYLDLFVIMSLGALCLISLGLLFAARTSSEELAGGLLNLVSWPMMFLSGVWFSLEGANPWVKKFALIFPLTHVIDAARAIMTEGASLMAVQWHAAALILMTGVFLALGSVLFRWE